MPFHPSPSEDLLISKLYGWIAGLVAVLAIIGVIYGKGRLDASHAASVASLQNDLKVSQEVVKREHEARTQDAILATEAAKRQTALKIKIDGLESYVDTLEDRDRQCLSGPDVDRLRDLWAR